MAGKGDTYRQIDYKKWSEGWERVFGKNAKSDIQNDGSGNTKDFSKFSKESGDDRKIISYSSIAKSGSDTDSL